MDDSLMNWIGQLLFGLVQGLTEVFPISSSAHVAIGQVFWTDFTGRDTVTFSISVFFHMGTFVAILLFYQRDVFLLWRSAVRTMVHWPRRWRAQVSEEYPLGQQTPFLLLLSLAVTGLLGLLLRARAEAVFGQPFWAAVFLVANGLFLLATAWYLRRGSVLKLDIAGLAWWHYVVIGTAQGLAVVPGLSRFGLTLIAGLLCGLGWYQALKLSFLLSLPTVLAATALELYEAPPGLDAQVLLPLASAMIVAGVGAFAAIRLIRREALHAPRALANFGFYCVAAGLFYSLYVYWLG